MRKLVDVYCVVNSYSAQYKGYYDDKDKVRPFVLYLEHYTYNTEKCLLDKHKNKIARYGDYKSLLRDIADRF